MFQPKDVEINLVTREQLVDRETAEAFSLGSLVGAAAVTVARREVYQIRAAGVLAG